MAPVLVQRFREREENVKMDVFTTFVDLLRQVGVVSKRFEGVQVCCSPTGCPASPAPAMRLT